MLCPFWRSTNISCTCNHLNHMIKLDALDNDMSWSDLLLVTDGKFPNSPVSNLILAKLEGLKQQTGMEIHGLLVRRKERKRLNLLCTDVHNFLGHYEGINGATYYYGGTMQRSSSALSLLPLVRRSSSPLPAYFCGRPLTRCFGFSLCTMIQPGETDR